jgi:Zn2+/Cd2+-exporting ATPase
MKITLFIEEMDCPDEERLIRSRLERHPEVESLTFDLLNKQLTVDLKSGDSDAVLSALEGIGMTAVPTSISKEDSNDAAGDLKDRRPIVSRSTWIQLGLAFVLAVSAEILSLISPPDSGLVVAALSLTAIVLGGRTMLKKGIRAIKARSLGINFLMTIAVGGALIIGEWPEAAMVTVLFELAERIEQYAMDRSRGAIRSLLKLSPSSSMVLSSSGKWAKALTSSIMVGQRIRISPGDLIPLDGKVVAGATSINQASITGESIPVAKQIGDSVFAGTLNEYGSVEVEVTSRKNDTTLARIIQAVKAAQLEKSPTQRFVDTFSKFYTPSIVSIAFLVVLIPVLFGAPFMLWLYRALVLLVIACPCALVISTPVTVVSGLTAATKMGMLVKGGTYLEQGFKLKVVALDKTGTLTEGRPKIVEMNSVDEGILATKEALRISASLNAQSEHSIARAFTKAAELGGLESELSPVNDFRAEPGRGVTGSINGNVFWLGNHRYAHNAGVCNPDIEAQLSRIEESGKTAIVLFNTKQALAIFGIADTLRSTSQEAVQQLQEMSIRVVMLTGDNSSTANAIASEVGIEDVYGELLPDEKLTIIGKLKAEYGMIAMVGDGINDAPALTKADIGFAMGTEGSDVAIESAGVALIKDDLRKIASFIKLSRATSNVLKQNISFAIGIKIVFLGLAVFGLATLWMAVVADMGASLLVTFNGLRLSRKSF